LDGHSAKRRADGRVADAGAAVYKAARAKDTAALLATEQSINASCTTCHKQFRFNNTTTAGN
jgi:cytochrome c556